MSTSETLSKLKKESLSGALAKAPLSELEEYSSALCHSQAFSYFGASEFPQICETVRIHLLRAHIETLQAQVVAMQSHITKLNSSNTKLTKWVIALAVAALLSSLAQVVSPHLFPVQPIVIVQPASAGQSESPNLPVNPSPDQTNEK
jgi:hypothetical protein